MKNNKLKYLISFLLLSSSIQYGISQDCGQFHLFNFQDTLITGWWDEPKNGFTFEMTYDTIWAPNTGYINFIMIDDSGDTITDPEYYAWSYFWPWNLGDTLKYTMALDNGLTSFPQDFTGHLATENPTCQIPFSMIPTSTATIIEDDELFLFPNPVRDILRVHPPSKVKTFSILDLEGRVLAVSNSQNGLNTNHLSNGVYVVKIISNDGKMFHKKMVKATKF